MSWIEDHEDQILMALAEDSNEIDFAIKKLEECKLDDLVDICKYLELFTKVIEYYKVNKKLSERQKFVLASFMQSINEFYLELIEGEEFRDE